jgi:hypothetical protein
VHQVEAMNAALRQMLSDLTTESRAVRQDLYSALLLCSEIDIKSEQRRAWHTEAVLRSEIQLLNDELEGTRMSLEDHAPHGNSIRGSKCGIWHTASVCWESLSMPPTMRAVKIE